MADAAFQMFTDKVMLSPECLNPTRILSHCMDKLNCPKPSFCSHWIPDFINYQPLNATMHALKKKNLRKKVRSDMKEIADKPAGFGKSVCPFSFVQLYPVIQCFVSSLSSCTGIKLILIY
jgi:hypothetical protein